MDFATRFDNISMQMQLNFERVRGELPHAGEKGTSFEEIFREFLKHYFPKTLDISTGFIIDSNDNISKQMDVIISDAARTPIFYQDKGKRVIPAECVYAVIEVKAKLDSDELKRIFENMKSVYDLEKKAYTIPHHDNFFSKVYGISPIYPTNYFIFALDSIDLRILADTMKNKYDNENIPYTTRIDSSCVFKKGVICNGIHDGVLDALPTPNSKVVCVYTERALLLFYILISQHLFQAQMPFFNIMDYTQGVNF